MLKVPSFYQDRLGTTIGNVDTKAFVSRCPGFLEVSHQAPHPPMDITDAMQATMQGRETVWPKVRTENAFFFLAPF